MIGCERAIGKKKNWTQQTHLRHTPHDTNTKGSWQFRRLVRRRYSPGLVLYSPSPLVGISGLSGQVTDGGMFFASRLNFYALSAIRIRRPSCFNVRGFPESSNARVGTHEMHVMQTF